MKEDKNYDDLDDNELLIETFPIDILEDIGLNEKSTVGELIELVRMNPLPEDFDGDEMLKMLGDALGIDYFDDDT